MRKARFTEHQIIAVIKSVEAGRTVKDVCREAGISEATYYIYGLPVSSAINTLSAICARSLRYSLSGDVGFRVIMCRAVSMSLSQRSSVNSLTAASVPSAISVRKHVAHG